MNKEQSQQNHPADEVQRTKRIKDEAKERFQYIKRRQQYSRVSKHTREEYKFILDRVKTMAFQDGSKEALHISALLSDFFPNIALLEELAGLIICDLQNKTEYAIELEKTITELENKYLTHACESQHLRKHICQLQQIEAVKSHKIDELISAKQKAKQKQVSNRKESFFRRDIFLPAYIEWQEGGIDYKSKAEFYRQMQTQFKTLAETNNWRKKTISERAMIKWLKETPNVETAKAKIAELTL